MNRAADTPVVAVTDLSKRYDDLVAVDSLSFKLESGSITAFLGPNGAGKSTTLRLLLGLAEPTDGEALVFGSTYHDLPNPARSVGALLEANDFDPGRSGRNHLRVLALAAGIAEERVEELLRLVELAHAGDRPVKGYSLGMRQRLGLAAALLGEPKLLILDEPMNGLDPVAIRWLRDFLSSFAERGGTVLLASHGLAEVAKTADRALIIGGGRLVANVSFDELPGGAGSLEDLYLELTAGQPA